MRRFINLFLVVLFILTCLPTQTIGATDTPNVGVIAYTSSGRVVDGHGNPIAGVTVYAEPTGGDAPSGDKTTKSLLGALTAAGLNCHASTNDNGEYTITELSAGTYVLRPEKNGYIFVPPTRTISVPPNASGQNFVGAAYVPTIPAPTRTPTPSHPAPIVTSIEPDSGPNNQVTWVQISGANFWGTPSVRIGETELHNVARLSATRLLALVPALLPAGTHDVRVCNPDHQCARLEDGYTVTGSAPVLLGIVPSQGLNNAPNEVRIYGFNLQPGISIRLGTRPLTVVWRNTMLVKAVVPAGMEPGTYDVVAQNPGSPLTSTLPDAYTVIAPAGDDFYIEGSDIWTFPITIRQGDTVMLGVNVHRQGGHEPLQVEVAFYLGNPNSGGELIGRTITPPMRPGRGVIESVFVPWDTDELSGAVEVYVVLDPDGHLRETSKANNVAHRRVVILPPAQDDQPPVITRFVVNGGARVTEDPNITIEIQAVDKGGSGVGSMYLVEREFNSSARQWVVVQQTGWIPFQSPYELTLTDHGGVRYIQAWVADRAGNISERSRAARINYHPPSSYVREGQVRVYRRAFAEGDLVTITLETLSGDADLYVWSPDGTQSWMSYASGTATDRVSFTAPVAGEYQIEVYGYQDSQYRLNVTTGALTNSAEKPLGSTLTADKTVPTQPVTAPDTAPEENLGLEAAPVSAQSDTVALALQAGWNLVSLPLAPVDTAITQVLSSIAGHYDLAYIYEAADAIRPWKKYSTTMPPFLNSLSQVNETQGLWVRTTEAVSLTVTGYAPAPAGLALKQGWNLVGYPAQATRPVTVALASIEGQYDLVYAYNAADTLRPWKKYSTTMPPFLNTLKEMEPNLGYWIRVKEDCTWQLP